MLGGTVFLSREVAAEALRRGHDVTCACRGVSGDVPDGATLLTWDRAEEPPAELAGEYDAVVDVSRRPSHVRRAVGCRPGRALGVRVDRQRLRRRRVPGGPGTLPLHEPITDDVDLATDPEAYGPMKVACEQIVRDGRRVGHRRPSGPDRRPRRPDRTVHLLAGPARRRRRGARPGSTRPTRSR